jgi:hypothetical protein
MPLRFLTAATLVAILAIPVAADDRFGAESASVESIRGRKFTAPVERRTIERSRLKDFLQKQIERDLQGGADGYLEALKALYLIEPDVSIEPLLELYDAQVLAFYDPEEHVYYSIDAPPKGVAMPAAMVEAVEVHELMHALQDQAFGAGRTIAALQADWDATMAYQSVLEGEATLVMLAHLGATLGVDLETLIGQEGVIESLREAAAGGEAIPAGVPRYFVDSLQFPYVDGLAFVIDAYKAGGWKAIDAIHADPPATTEEILRPALYRERVAAGTQRERVAEKASEGELARTALGEYHWRFLLGRVAGEGWGRDRVVVRRGVGGSTVLVDSSWDSEKDAREFADALAPLLERHKARNARLAVAGAKVLAAWGGDAKAVEEFVGATK